MQNKTKQSRKTRKNVNVVSRVPRIHAQQPMLQVRFKYSVYAYMTELTTTSGTMYSFRINSLYDPDLSSTGKQPLAFDQYSALFARYRVIAGSVKLSIMNAQSQTNAANTPSRVGFYCTTSSAVPSDPEAWSNQFGAQDKLIGPTTGNQGVVNFRTVFNYPQIFGIRPSELKDSDFSATIAANPARIAYMHVFAHSIYSGQVAAVIFTADFEFVAELSDRQPVTMS